MLSAGRRAHQIWGRWEYHRIFGGKPPDEVNLGLETLASLGQWKNSYEVTPICRRSRISHEHNGHLWMENANFGVRNSSRPDARLIFRTGIIFQFVCKSKNIPKLVEGTLYRKPGLVVIPSIQLSIPTMPEELRADSDPPVCDRANVHILSEVVAKVHFESIEFSPKKMRKIAVSQDPNASSPQNDTGFMGSSWHRKCLVLHSPSKGRAEVFLNAAGHGAVTYVELATPQRLWISKQPTLVIPWKPSLTCGFRNIWLVGLHMITYCRLISAL